ncbi:hypothetical protein [Actinocorallia longicatena]|uniref:Secreted protein n=1 Tax=Actinocorallia longicatena TaxID=111803 RepID=A0ABP6QK46_9ACTN
MRRLATVLASAALALGVTANPAHAANTYHPSEADFADCPAPPAGASGWTCYAFTALDGQFRLKNMTARVNNPIRLTVGQGTVGGATVAVVGSLKGDPMPFVRGVLGTPLEIPDPTGWKVQIEATGKVTPGFLYPSEIGVKAKIIGSGLGDNCYIGASGEPTVLKPRTQWMLPWLFDGVPMLQTKVYDDIFTIDWATGCESPLVNTLIGKANATSNHMDITWAVRHKTIQ